MSGRSLSRTTSSRSVLPVLALRDAVYFPGTPNTLHVGREPSVRALRRCLDGSRRVLVISQRDMAIDEPGPADLFAVGTECEILHALPLPDTTLRVSLRGLQRAMASRVTQRKGILSAQWSPVPETLEYTSKVEALMRECVTLFAGIVELGNVIPPEAALTISHIADPSLLADSIAHHMPLRPLVKQGLLEESDVERRLERLFEALKIESEVIRLGVSIHHKVEAELAEGQREYWLREQLKAIQGELQLRENRVGETEEYLAKIEAAAMPVEVRSRAEAEVRRLDRTPVSSPEGQVSRTYLDALLAFPWEAATEDQLDIQAAAAVLDENHFGLATVKDRILEQLAVRRLRKSQRGPILCFVGPPGVGKTSVARSVADAMGRRFARISVGGMLDEAELRGHRRTYVGAMPGRIVQSMIQCGSRNPVIVIDEVDKLGVNGRGDPIGALLEIFDTEQNTAFMDHYLDAPVDLSSVLFIATANSIHTMSSALRDRMEIVAFTGYSDVEKLRIARDYLLPKALVEHGLAEIGLEVSDAALELVIGQYTRESGARHLGRQLNAIARRLARRVAEGATELPVVDEQVVHELLGVPPYQTQETTTNEPGVAWGLVVSEAGGDVLPVEVALLPALGGRPELRLTGSLGEVMKESAEAALSLVRKLHGARLGKVDIHLHLPEGAVPKEGPSAGITMVSALASAALERSLPDGWAMTGEISIRGRVLGVGGIREKLLAAVRVGMTDVIIPKANIAELPELPSEVAQALTIHAVTHVAEALDLIGLL